MFFEGNLDPCIFHFECRQVPNDLSVQISEGSASLAESVKQLSESMEYDAPYTDTELFDDSIKTEDAQNA